MDNSDSIIYKEEKKDLGNHTHVHVHHVEGGIQIPHELQQLQQAVQEESQLSQVPLQPIHEGSQELHHHIQQVQNEVHQQLQQVQLQAQEPQFEDNDKRILSVAALCEPTPVSDSQIPLQPPSGHEGVVQVVDEVEVEGRVAGALPHPEQIIHEAVAHQFHQLQEVLEAAENSAELEAAIREEKEGVDAAAKEHRLSTGERKRKWRVSFDVRLDELKRFKEAHGHLNIPKHSSRCDPQWSSLVNWVQHIRFDSRYELTEEEIQKLKEIGFNYEIQATPKNPATPSPEGKKPVKRKNFSEWLEELKKFKEVHGHTRVPRHESEWKSLGKWVSNVRSAKKGMMTLKLTEDQIKQLDEIGFVWDASDDRSSKRRK